MDTENQASQVYESLLFLRIFKTFRIAIQPGKMFIALLALGVIGLAGFLMDFSRTVVVTHDANGVVVDTEKGPYVITGDAVFKYANLEGAPEERLPFLMSGIYTDMLAMWKSFELIDGIVKGDYSKVIPGHDSLVFQKERYP